MPTTTERKAHAPATVCALAEIDADRPAGAWRAYRLALVYALLMPFVALVTAYVYFDSRARLELEPVALVSELPAEIELAR